MVSRFRWFDKGESDRGKYACKEEFVSVFESERMVLQRLALLLTANTEAAERCLALALQECIASSSVSKDWVLAWARRVVIRNAANLVMEMKGNAERGSIVFTEDGSLSQIANFEAILALPDLDRLVFVICILECHSVQDCALLLERPPREVIEARRRATDQFKEMDQSNDGLLRLGDGSAQIVRNGGAR